MAWTEFFLNTLPNGKVVVSPDGRPFVSMAVAPREYVEVSMTQSIHELPFKVTFKCFNSIGELTEEREYGVVGTKDLARKLAMEVANMRLNSMEFVLDGE